MYLHAKTQTTLHGMYMYYIFMICHTNIELLGSWHIELKVFHVLSGLVDHQPPSKLSWCEPERVARLTVQLELSMNSTSC